jgi:OPT oligopeptide transporter protein
MFISQVISTIMGCIIGPFLFWIFYNAYPVGDPNSEYPAPYARVYRGIAILGVDGFSVLPQNSVKLCLAFFFFFAFVVSATREALKYLNSPIFYYVPSAMGWQYRFN